MLDREDYFVEGYKQLNDESIYVEVKHSKTRSDLIEKSNNFFKLLNKKKINSEKELKYLLYSFKIASCLGKIHLLPKIHKRLYNVPRRPVISNCGNPTEKVSEFLEHLLQPVMKSRKSYVKDTGDFLEKIKSLGRIPEDAFLVTADVVDLYPSILHDAGLKALYENLEVRSDKKVLSVDLVDAYCETLIIAKTQ